MWAHYGEPHRGICLEFDTTREFGAALQVVYRDDMALIRPPMFTDHRALAAATVLSKSSEWRYEDDYRILARDEPSDPTFHLTARENYVILPTGNRTAIVAGCNVDVHAIRSLLDEHGAGVGLKRAIR